MQKETSAGFVVFYEEKGQPRQYLLLKYPEGHFDFPKGHLNSGETKLIGALRELEEETGISVIEKIPHYEEKISYKFKNRSGILINKDVFYFLGRVLEKTVKISHEHTDFEWLNYQEAHQKVTFKNAQDLLVKSEQLLNHSN